MAWQTSLKSLKAAFHQHDKKTHLNDETAIERLMKMSYVSTAEARYKNPGELATANQVADLTMD